MHELKTIRVYDLPESDKGYRILVDRLWPRGIRKDALRLDIWAKEIAPSKELRQWFDHSGERFTQFETAYRMELFNNTLSDKFISTVAKELRSQDVLLIYAAKDTQYNNAVVLMKWVQERLAQIQNAM